MLINNNYLWNEVTKKEKLKMIINYFKKNNFEMDYNISLYILKNFMKPDLSNNSLSNKLLSNFPVYFGCEKIFPKNIIIKLTRCNGCNVRTNNLNDIIKLNNNYYNVCSCGKNYCLQCFQEFFIKYNKIPDKIKCRGCSEINNINDIQLNKSGILPYNLSKLKFKYFISNYLLSINFYHKKSNYMYGQKIVYTINLDLSNNNIKKFTLKKLLNKIIKYKKYYSKKKFSKIIIFSKFYYFLNEIFNNKLKDNNIYNNSNKMLELYIVLESIIKYY